MTDDRIAVNETIPLPDVLRALTRDLTAMTVDRTSGFEARAAELTVRLLIDTDAGEPRFRVVGPQTPETAETTTHTLKLTLQPLVGEPTQGVFAPEPQSEESADALRIPFADTIAQSAETLHENVPEPAHIPDAESAEPQQDNYSADFEHTWTDPISDATSATRAAESAGDAESASTNAFGDERFESTETAAEQRDSRDTDSQLNHTDTSQSSAALGNGQVEQADYDREGIVPGDSRNDAASVESGYDNTLVETPDETHPEAGELVQATTAESPQPRHLTVVESDTESEHASVSPADPAGPDGDAAAESPDPHRATDADSIAASEYADTVRPETPHHETKTEPAEAPAAESPEPHRGTGPDPVAASEYTDAVQPETPDYDTDIEPALSAAESSESHNFSAGETTAASDATGTPSAETYSEPLGLVDDAAAGSENSPEVTAGETAAEYDRTDTTPSGTSRNDADREPIDAPVADAPQSPSHAGGVSIQGDSTEPPITITDESAEPVDDSPEPAQPTDTARTPVDSTVEPESPQDAVTGATGPEDTPTSPIPRTPEQSNPTQDRIGTGSAYSDLDDEHAEVIARYEKILVDRERAMGPLHRHTLISAGNLARAYREAGRSSQAIDVYERVLTDSESTFGPQDLDTLIFRGSLARCYREAGRMVEAIDLYERTLADSEQGFGPDHKNTLTARHNLALAYREDGRLDDAIALYRTCLADSERLLGSNHRDTLITCDSLASCLREAGKVSKATALDERLLSARRRVLGPDHPDTLHSTINLASDRAAANRAGDAADLYEQASNTSERVLGPDHPISERARIGLAHAYAEVGRASEAAELFERLLADCERQLGPDHRHTLIARNNLAVAYHDAGRFSEAIEAHTRTAEDRERLLGPDHPDTLKSREHLAYSYEAQLLARTSGPQIPVPQE
ncbi:tetratricopeptide repeat protein [Nocardia miyunensis]|uniref:tetratricopeptide repeat protein n=1 Tax=Nocardia miyunensis TaxID=282684 RepID=UPI000B057B52|nr:tetratricopeptide repeat protein [Nocardia miyunensis]